MSVEYAGVLLGRLLGNRLHLLSLNLVVMLAWWSVLSLDNCDYIFTLMIRCLGVLGERV